MCMVAARAPVNVGANFTVTVQLPLAGIEGMQLFVWLNCAAPVPVMVIFEKVTVLTERLVNVSGKELVVPAVTLPKSKFVADCVISVPVPDKLTVCGLLAALSVMVRFPV